jgi:hypothetical protein
LEHTAFNAHPAAWNKGTVIALVDALHFGLALGVSAFWELWFAHTKCIRFLKIKKESEPEFKPMARFELATSS